MQSPLSKPLDDQYINFMMKCSDFNNLEFINFQSIPIGSELFVVHAIESKNTFSDYAFRKYILLDFNASEKYIELEDTKGNYVGIIPFGKNGNPIYSINKITGEPDVFEKTFSDYISSQRYMSHLKYICDVLNDAVLLKILQQINKSEKRK